jgi:hypothetical protein
MRDLLLWLDVDSLPWDAIGTYGVVLVVIGLVVAIIRKAIGTLALAKTTKSKDDPLHRSAETSKAFPEQETFPNILIGAATTRTGEIVKDTLAILNAGGGRAKDLRLRYRDQTTPFEIRLDKQSLIVRDVLPVPIDAGRGAASGFQLTYRTDFGSHCALDFEWDENASRAVHERLTLI